MTISTTPGFPSQGPGEMKYGVHRSHTHTWLERCRGGKAIIHHVQNRELLFFSGVRFHFYML